MNASSTLRKRESVGAARRYRYTVAALMVLAVGSYVVLHPSMKEDYWALFNDTNDRTGALRAGDVADMFNTGIAVGVGGSASAEKGAEEHRRLQQEIENLQKQIREQQLKIEQQQMQMQTHIQKLQQSPQPQEKQAFLAVASKTNTDKIKGYGNMDPCLKEGKNCGEKDAERQTCRPFGHFYDTIYDRWLGKYSSETADPIQFLEIGYFRGDGFEAFTKYLPTAELHSMEISCLPEGPVAEGKWPWGNFGKNHKMYEDLRKNKRLHCGDASRYDFLNTTWTKEMKRPDAPPLMVVIDDASHLSKHMATSLFFWFPRIQPGGILVVEDIQPTSAANDFRTLVLPQVMKDLHWCGIPGGKRDKVCFPTIQPLLASVHCEMHICVFVRNDFPAYEPDEAGSMPPPDYISGTKDCLFVT